MQAYKGYVENGQFYPIGQIIRTSRRIDAVVTLLEDEEAFTSAKQPSQYGRGCMKGKMWMADDFDAPLEDFREYME